MGNKFSFDHLSSTDFEEFCYDLLESMGFKVNWRKGTGKEASPADNGRDIEAKITKKDVDGEDSIERWFIECKHQKEGIPPTELKSLFAWADAERPDKALIIVSNFLSNPCKNYIEQYKSENKPSYSIKYWEVKDLERLSFPRNKLRNKHKLSDGMEFVEIMNPIHLWYLSELQANSLDYLFSILDKIDSRKRDEFFNFVYLVVVNPKWRKPVTGKETVGDLLIDKPNYDLFKKKCYDLKQQVAEPFLVKSIITCALEVLFSSGNKTRLEYLIQNHKWMLKRIPEELKNADGEKKQGLLSTKKFLEDSLKNLPKRMEKNYILYNEFCESVLTKLAEEDAISRIDGNLEKLKKINSEKLPFQ